MAGLSHEWATLSWYPPWDTCAECHWNVNRELKQRCFKRGMSTGSKPFSLQIYLDATEFVSLSVFARIETVCLRISSYIFHLCTWYAVRKVYAETQYTLASSFHLTNISFPRWGSFLQCRRWLYYSQQLITIVTSLLTHQVTADLTRALRRGVWFGRRRFFRSCQLKITFSWTWTSFIFAWNYMSWNIRTNITRAVMCNVAPFSRFFNSLLLPVKAPARTKNARNVQVTSDNVTRANRLSFWQKVKTFIDNEY